MSTNKHALIRYKALDYCFANFNKKYYVVNLIDACNRAIANYYGYDPDGEVIDGINKYFIHRRSTLYDDITFMRERWDAPIQSYRDGQKVYYRYTDPDFSISKTPLSESEIDSLKETLLMLNRFKGMPHFEWMEELLSKLEDRFAYSEHTSGVIGFEQNKDYYLPENLFTNIFHAILNKQPLLIHYRNFGDRDFHWDIHPYYIKQYNNRWFLLGLNNNEYRNITIIPLDRIVTYEQTNIPYIPTNIDFEEYFDNVVGISNAEGTPETILLKFSPKRLRWVLTKPFHGSMKLKNKDDGIVEFRLVPNNELISEILSFGNDVEVIEPQSLRQVIAEKVSELNEKYSTCTVVPDKSIITLHRQTEKRQFNETNRIQKL